MTCSLSGMGMPEEEAFCKIGDCFPHSASPLHLESHQFRRIEAGTSADISTLPLSSRRIQIKVHVEGAIDCPPITSSEKLGDA